MDIFTAENFKKTIQPTDAELKMTRDYLLKSLPGNFETNSATLTGDSRPILDTVAADLKKYPRLKVEVQGHTDSVGADAYNLGLSQRRAASVREYLLSQGVASAQLTAKGYGETQPVADNTTPAGRQENRRVALSVLDNPGDVDVKEAR